MSVFSWAQNNPLKAALIAYTPIAFCIWGLPECYTKNTQTLTFQYSAITMEDGKIHIFRDNKNKEIRLLARSLDEKFAKTTYHVTIKDYILPYKGPLFFAKPYDAILDIKLMQEYAESKP
jgi:hypothetical protein